MARCHWLLAKYTLFQPDTTDNARRLTLLRLNKLPEAVEAFQRAIELETNYADSHYNLACTYSRLNRFEECLNHLSRAKELDGFQGMNPLLDPDLAGINNAPNYSAKFRALAGAKTEKTQGWQQMQ
jgi:tetratricopeptide (TPR) repeat protein